MNRQQRNLVERENEKKIKHMTKELRKNAKNSYDILKADSVEWALALKKRRFRIDGRDIKETDLLTIFTDEASQKELNSLSCAYDITLRNWMYEHGYNPNVELKKIWEILKIENKYVNKFMEGSYFMELEKDRAVIIKDYEEMKKKIVKESQILESLYFKYPQYTKNSIKGVIRDYKEENKKKVQATKENVKNVLEENKDDPDMKAIENYIFGDGEKPVIKDKAKKPTENTEKSKEHKKINSKLKVKSIIVEDEEGREYIKENGIVTVGSEKFNNADALEKYKTKELAAYKKSHDERMTEINKMIAELNKDYEKEKVSFLKKINNIADVMMM